MSAPDSNRLSSGRAYAELSSWRKLAVSGEEAWTWLNGLISADVADLRPGQARESLLLSPTGRIKAAFTVTARPGEAWLLQDRAQPRWVGDLLAPYVLSANVSLRDLTDEASLFAFPGRSDPPLEDAWVSTPSCLGTGLDVIAPAGDADRVRERLRVAFGQATDIEVDAWRIARGLPRFGVDALDDDLPQEAGLDHAVAFDKGCYLGQESVAKVRNLGHPRRLVVAVASTAPVHPGDAILANGGEAGVVTSAASEGERWVALARITWEARELPLRTRSGGTLLRAERAGHPSRPV